MQETARQTEARYTIVHNGCTFYSGTLFLKAIAVLVNIDTASSIADVHAQLHALDIYMRTNAGIAVF